MSYENLLNMVSGIEEKCLVLEKILTDKLLTEFLPERFAEAGMALAFIRRQCNVIMQVKGTIESEHALPAASRLLKLGNSMHGINNHASFWLWKAGQFLDQKEGL